MSTAENFKAMKALFEIWAENGVPHGIKYPKTQSAAVGWSCPPFGIEGVGSKREFKTTHETYGTIVKEISALIKRLKPIDEVLRLRRENLVSQLKPPNKRKYVTQKARRVAAEDQTGHVSTMLENTLKQLQETRQQMESIERDLKYERQRVSELQRTLNRMGEENAQLKQKLTSGSRILQLVE